MAGPSGEYFSVQEVKGAGRGAVARCGIVAGTCVLESENPVAHVIFYQYRKEVCAHCFHYDRGRALPFRDQAVGKVFCTAECHHAWLKDQGELGVEAWQNLHAFIHTKAKNISIQQDHDFRPGDEAQSSTWQHAEEIASLQRKGRCDSVANSGPGIKAEKSYRQALYHTWRQTLDPDILGFLLSGILYYHKHPDKWRKSVSTLAKDATPYRSTNDLEVHCNSFLQLTAVQPHSLLSSVTPEVCQELIIS